MVSYCDDPVSGVRRRASPVVRRQQHLLLNHIANCIQTSQKLFLSGALSNLFKENKFHLKLRLPWQPIGKVLKILSEITRPRA